MLKTLRYSFRILTLAACLSIAQVAPAADKSSLQELPPSKGFPSDVNAILMEDDGICWVGADDGTYLILGQNDFKHFSTFNSNLPGNKVSRLCKDSDGYVWALTDNGIVGYQSALRSDELVYIFPENEDIVAHSVISVGSCVYFGTENCIWKYDHRTKAFSVDKIFETNSPFTITEMLRGTGNNGNDIILLSKGSDTYYIYNIQTKEIRSTAAKFNGTVLTGFTDSTGILWLSLFNAGVCCITNDGTVKDSFNTSNSSLTSDVVLCMEEVDGKVWLGTEGGGINIIDPVTRERTIASFNGDIYLPTSTVSSLCRDKFGNMWCGRKYGGIFVISYPEVSSVLTEDFDPAITPDGINCLFQYPDDSTIWIGTAGSGLISYDPQSGAFTAYRSTEGLDIFSIAAVDRDNLAFSCPSRGGFSFNIPSGKLDINHQAYFIYYSSLSGEDPYLVNDVDGSVVTFGKTIRRWNSRTASMEMISSPMAQVAGEYKPVTGSKARYVIDEARIYKWDETDRYRIVLLKEMPQGVVISSATIDDDGTIWIASGEDVYSYSVSTDEFKQVLILDSPIMAILPDMSGRIWIGTAGKLYSFNPSTKALETLSAIDGVAISDFKPGAMLRCSDGSLVMGGQSGFLTIDSTYSPAPPSEYHFAMMSINVDGNEIIGTSDIVIPTSHSNLEFVFFDGASNLLKSRLHHVVVSGASGIKFDEILENSQIHITHLDPGKYTVSVSSVDASGNWTEMEDFYTFHVARPWFMTIWFSIILILLLSGLALYWLRHFLRERELDREKASSDERYNFLLNVSHELRTPLTLISGPLRRYLRTHKDLDEDSRETIGKVCIQADRMTSLLDTVLTTSRIQDGSIKVQFSPILFNDWVERCLGQLRAEATDRGMKFVSYPDSTIGTVQMDEHLCTVVMTNMISNAMRHNEPGSPITIWTEWNSTNGTVRVNVKDHGSGIGKVDVSHLFERYYQASEESTGFGIGLAYSKGIVDAHHGLIGAYNNSRDRGATFWLELPADSDTRVIPISPAPAFGTAPLPAEQGPADAPGISWTEPDAPHAPRKPVNDVKVLFVDDDKDLREYVKEELGQYCAEVYLAYSGYDALDALDHCRPDVVITDVMMPEMDGIELCRRLKTTPMYQYLPVIMLTARSDEKTVEQGHEAGADYYMPKPFDIDQLLDVIGSKI